MEIRNYHAGDFGDLLRLGNELDLYGQNLSQGELEAILVLPKNDPEKNAFMVVEGDKVLGYARILRNRDGTINRHHVSFRLTPDLQKNGSLFDELFARVEDRLNEISGEYDSGLQIRLNCYDQEEKPLAAAFERHGFKLVRYFARLDRKDISGLEKPVLPERVTVRRFEPEQEQQEYLEAYNHACEGDFEFHPSSTEMLGQFLKTPFYQAERCFVAKSDGRIIGFCENYLIPERERDGILWGIVSDLGVVPEQRGRGVGRALIRHGMLALRDAGAESLCLWMDYANPFGAKKLYHSEGFRDRYVSRAYARDETGA